MTAWRGLALALLLAVSATAARAAEPVTLPKALAERLQAAQKELSAGRPASAIERLRSLPEDVEDHPLRHLILGHAWVRQSNLRKAAEAYARAIAMAPSMTDAGLALAQVRARQERWRDAANLLGTYVDIDSCQADVLFLYAQAARALEDDRLARLLAETALVRFPSEARFRRLDLAVAFDEGDPQAVARAARYLLARSPADADLWRRLAWALGERGAEADRAAALEAAVLCAPADLAGRRALLAALLAAGNWPAVLARGRDLLAGPLAEKAAADVDLMDLLVRAADAGRADATLRAWLDRVPASKRTRAMRLAETRLALRQGKTGEARTVLRQLIEMGDTDTSVFLWAGHLAETADDLDRAEASYARARSLAGRDAHLATLYLARLSIRRGRDAEAVRLLRGYLETRPEDAVARSLLALAQEGVEGGEG